MDTILAGLPQVAVHLDDILVVSETEEEHEHVLTDVFRRLAKAGLRVQANKCEFFKQSLEFLGHRIDQKGVYPAETKVEAIHKAPAPTNKKELQAFLGMINFYNRFLHGRSETAEKLYRLLDKNANWKWDEKHQEAFECLKKSLTSVSLLVHFNESAPLIFSCDASPVGVGAVLAHGDNTRIEQPIAYASRTLTKAERNYAQIDREALAVVFGARHFHQYLAGRKFVIFTDHKPLLGIFRREKQIPEVLSPRMLRWSLMLSAYEYQLEYRKTQDHANADCLSRLPAPGCHQDAELPGDVLLLEAVEYPPVTAGDIAACTAQDIQLSRVTRWIVDGWPEERVPEEYGAYEVRQHELSLHRDCVVWGNRVVVPEALQKRVLVLLHAEHPGVSAMKAIARSHVWWSRMDAQIEEFVRHCTACQENRQSEPRVPTHFWTKPERLWSRIHLDFAGPINGVIFLVVVDAFSNWAEVEMMTSARAPVVIERLRKMFATYGLPDLIVSDNGEVFTSEEMQSFLKINGIQSMYTAPYHPSSNGRAECMVRELKCALKKQSQGTLACKVSRFLFKQHSTPHSETGKAPAELMLGWNLRSSLARLHPDTMHVECMRQLPPRSFQCGDSGYIRNFRPGPRWLAARVLRRRGHVMYDVLTADGSTHRRHRDHVRRAWNPTPVTTVGGTSASFALPEPSSLVPAPAPAPADPVELRRSTRTRRAVRRYGFDD
ncbi:uncharacterized protein K02A2.6-like [Rhipicephalus sanguineus]|uniref:uncharacterized protein K02A2.6-like n=1 Tax=Rhipicephalus sanguineus TaxID=34632 RepID=UPI001894AE5F|nr:uncharacterized protein K02A2.6-like [Rhipicephalus sanguineus]